MAVAGVCVTARVVVILGVAIAGRVVRKVFHFAGLGVADALLGIAVSVLKYLLELSVLFSAFDALNEEYCLVGPRTIEQSKSYKPVRWLSESIFPFLEWDGERVPRQEEKTERTKLGLVWPCERFWKLSKERIPANPQNGPVGAV